MAGLLRGVRPMGDWSMSMTLSKCSSPSIRSWAPGRVGRRLSRPESAFSSVSLTSVLFPEPDTPVTQVRAPTGKPTSMPRRLFCARALHGEPSPRRAPDGRDLHAAPARQERPGHRRRLGLDVGDRPLGHHPAAVLARARAHVDDVVGAADHLLVVLDHQHRVALVAEPLQGADQLPVVALVQPDGGLVEDVEHAHEARPDLGGQPDPLGLAARQRPGGAGEGEVADAHVVEEPQPLVDLLDHARADERLGVGQLQVDPKKASASDTDSRQTSWMFRPLDGDRQRLRAQPGAAAGRAGPQRHELLHRLPHRVRHRGGVLAPQLREDALEPAPAAAPLAPPPQEHALAPPRGPGA